MLTLNQTIERIKLKSENHAQINTFYFGDPWEYGAGLVGAGGAILYPFNGAQLIDVSLDGNIESTKITLFFCDLVHKDESNETEVLSDMKSVALDIMSQIRTDLQDNYNATVSNTFTLKPFTERFDDEVTGVECDLIIQQFYNRDTCQVPTKT